MFQSDFWERANIQQICYFINNGTQSAISEEGTFDERVESGETAFTEAIMQFQKAVTAFDWARCADEGARRAEVEGMWAGIWSTKGRLENLAFEMGFVAGLHIGLTFPENEGALGRALPGGGARQGGKAQNSPAGSFDSD